MGVREERPPRRLRRPRLEHQRLAQRVVAVDQELVAAVQPLRVADRRQPGKDVQQATGDSVELAFVDQGYTGEKPAAAAARKGIELSVVKLPQAKRGFVLLPRRWVVERSFAWTARFRRLARDYERLASTLAGFHFLAFACLMLAQLARIGESA